MVIETDARPKKLSGAAAMGAGPGRPKGSRNKVTVELKDMIRHALDNAGGVEYLTARAKDPKTAAAFLTLLGKVLPLQLTGANGRTLAEELAGLRGLPGAVIDAEGAD